MVSKTMCKSKFQESRSLPEGRGNHRLFHIGNNVVSKRNQKPLTSSGLKLLHIESQFNMLKHCV